MSERSPRNGIGGLRCIGCFRELEVGDRYIEDTSSGFLKMDSEPSVDGLMADVFGGKNGKVIFCEDCTEDGGDYRLETVYGDEADHA